MMLEQQRTMLQDHLLESRHPMLPYHYPGIITEVKPRHKQSACSVTKIQLVEVGNSSSEKRRTRNNWRMRSIL